MKLEPLYRWIRIFQLIFYGQLLIVFIWFTYQAWPNILYARYGRWHLTIIIELAAVFIYFRTKYPTTLRGTLLSLAVPTLAAILGEFYICLWIWAYYWPCVQGHDFYSYLFELGVPAFACLLAGTFKQLNWKRALITFTSLSLLFAYWIIIYNFHISISTCQRELIYYKEPTANIFEVTYWSLYLLLYMWTVKPYGKPP